VSVPAHGALASLHGSSAKFARTHTASGEAAAIPENCTENTVGAVNGDQACPFQRSTIP
jgi:hypothetical protein